jgi:hypothetical protein
MVRLLAFALQVPASDHGGALQFRHVACLTAKSPTCGTRT